MDGYTQNPLLSLASQSMFLLSSSHPGLSSDLAAPCLSVWQLALCPPQSVHRCLTQQLPSFYIFHLPKPSRLLDTASPDFSLWIVIHTLICFLRSLAPVDGHLPLDRDSDSPVHPPQFPPLSQVKCTHEPTGELYWIHLGYCDEDS